MPIPRTTSPLFAIRGTKWCLGKLALQKEGYFDWLVLLSSCVYHYLHTPLKCSKPSKIIYSFLELIRLPSCFYLTERLDKIIHQPQRKVSIPDLFDLTLCLAHQQLFLLTTQLSLMSSCSIEISGLLLIFRVSTSYATLPFSIPLIFGKQHARMGHDRARFSIVGTLELKTLLISG